MKIPDIKVELIPPWAWAALAGAGVYLAWKIADKGIAGTTAGLVSGAVGAASEVAGGVVQGLASIVGVPMTGKSECCAAIAGYNAAATTWERMKATFDVSALCPAGDYLAWAAGKGAPAYCAASLVTPKATNLMASTTKPAGQASPATGIMPEDLKCTAGGVCEGTDLSRAKVITTTGAMPGNFDLLGWISDRNGASYGKTIVPVAGIRG